MSEAAPNSSIIPDDPLLGAYVAHYPSSRLRLLIIAGLIFAVPSVFVLIFFSGLDAVTAPIVRVPLYSLFALLAAWYALHLWNREIILFQKGFTYREGSRVRGFLYDHIVTVRQEGERIAYLGIIRRDVERTVLISNEDEVMIVNNIYRDAAKLSQRIEEAVARARLPESWHMLESGSRLSFGLLTIDSGGAAMGAEHLPWGDYGGYSLSGGQLHLQDHSGQHVLQVPLRGLDNTRLLLALLRKRQGQA